MTADLFKESDAVLSDCGRYRYLLRRSWDASKPRALFVMLNPSTADAEIDDPTIRSCTRLCRSWGYGSFEVVNVFAFRATDPKKLAHADDRQGPLNDTHIIAALIRCDVVICAWGAYPIPIVRHRAIISMIQAQKMDGHCLGRTKKGHPKHPLYIKTGTPLEAYP